jgi:glycosyltransferase involved in cell wall biosynthesis
MTTPTSIPVSCSIIARNEEDRIGDVIRAIQGLVDEVVVIDSGSTDRTVEIAESLGARVLFHAWPGYGPQKRYAEDMARNDWILNLDADEIVTPELYQEIQALIKTRPPLNAYRMRIRNVYPGQAKPRLWADYHNYVRLYDKRLVRFRDSPVHDTVDTKSERVGQLEGTVAHFSARSYEHIRTKLDSYTDLQAKVLKKPEWTLWARLPFEYPAVFARYYIGRRHFTGGWDGIFSSHLAAEARVNRVRKFIAAKRAARGQTPDHA